MRRFYFAGAMLNNWPYTSCVDTIIESGIKLVYVGTLDLSVHAGRVWQFKEAGVTVEMASDDFGRQASRLNFILILI